MGEKPKEKKEEKKEEPDNEKNESKAENKEEAKEEEKEEAKPTDDKREPSVEITEEKEKIMVTKNKDLLLGCSYFDLSHCGYIESKDVEDILFPLELDLSRAEIKKLASKLAIKDQVPYRTLIDGEEGEDDIESSHEKDANVEELASGFKKFIPGDDKNRASEINTAENMVQYKGSVIDVAKLQEKLDKSERVRSATDLKLIDLQKKFSCLKESSDKSDKNRDKLGTDLRDVKKKVRTLEDELKLSQAEASRFFAMLTDVHNKIKPIVSPPAKTEDIATETVPQVNGLLQDSEEVTDKSEGQPETEKLEVNPEVKVASVEGL